MESSLRHSPPPVTVAAVAAVTGLLWLVFAAYSFHAAMPDNPLELPGESAAAMHLWAPQHWMFFSLDPQRTRRAGYILDADGRFRSASLAPRAQWHNAFGLNRSSEAVEREVELLLEDVPRALLSTCDGPPAACLERATSRLRIANRVPGARLCGTVGLVLSTPVPWAWRESVRFMTSHVVRLEVRC